MVQQTLKYLKNSICCLLVIDIIYRFFFVQEYSSGHNTKYTIYRL